VKEQIGALNALYPSLTTLVGAVVNGRENFIAVAHVGILKHSKNPYLTIALAKVHHTNKGIHDHQAFSVCVPSQKMVEITDYCGLVSGKNTDKSQLFDVFYGETSFAPMIKQCPVCMECTVHDVVDLKSHDIFIGEVKRTHVDPAVLDGKDIDITKVQPLLFDMASKKYFSLGEPVADCWSVGKALKKKD